MIIALTGPAGSGKSTAAKYLVERHSFTLVKFAGPLKSMLRCLGLGDREIEGDLKEQPHPVLGGKSPRHAMQTLGTEWGRNLIHSDLWVNVAIASAQACLDQGGRVVIDDLRFENEAFAIARHKGIIVRLLRPGSGIAGGHSSETQDFGAHWTVANDSAVKDLHAKLDNVIETETHLNGKWMYE